MMSTELAFEDFLRTVSPIRVQYERPFLPVEVIRARRYQEHTEALTDALRSGSALRLQAAVFSMELAA